ncbi:MAG: hypothetical protein AB1757_12600 [Acidobacteriota bacterium]
MRKAMCKPSIVVALILTNVLFTSAQDNPVGFVEWLNKRVKDAVAAKVNQRSNTNQAETPSTSGNTSSLLDQSSAPDLFGVALNLAGLSNPTKTETSGGMESAKEVNSASVTATAYSLYAALKRIDPLDPTFYNAHPDWRRLSFTLGYDNEKIDGVATPNQVTIFGSKYLIINHRDAARKCRNQTGAMAFCHETSLNNLTNSLAAASADFGKLTQEIQTFVLSQSEVVREFSLATRFKAFMSSIIAKDEASINRLQAEIADLKREIAAPNITQEQMDTKKKEIEDRQSRIEKLTLRKNKFVTEAQAFKDRDLESDFGAIFNFEKISQWPDIQKQFLSTGLNEIFASASAFTKLQAILGDEGIKRIDALIEKRLSSFIKLDEVANDAIDEIRNGTQFSIAVQTKTRKEGTDEYKAEVIYDKGVYKALNFTFNGAFEYKNNKAIGADLRGMSLAGQLELKITPDRCLECANPIRASLAYEGNWMSGQDWIHKVQGKVKIPIINGVDFPISFTYSNRTELIKEKDVRGQFGFTFDLSRLIKSSLFK